MTEFPAPELFDSRQARRAMRRGVFRTVGLVLVVLLVLSIANASLRALLQQSTGHEDALSRIGEVGVEVGHPDLFAGNGFSLHSKPDGGWIGGGTRFAISNHTTGRQYSVDVSTDWLGRIDRVSDLEGPLDRQLFRGRSGKKATAAFAKGLPDATFTTAIVSFARPAPPSELEQAFSDREWNDLLFGGAYFYDDPLQTDQQLERAGRHLFEARPVTWPAQRGIRGYPDFADWVETLSSKDDSSLDVLGLPGSIELRRMADADLVYAVYAANLDPSDLEALVANPAVESVVPVDVRFDFDAIKIDG